MTPREVLAFCREKDVKAVALRFADLFGAWRQQTIPLGKLDPQSFEDGFGCDGSSFAGWQAPHQSDLRLLPQADTAFLDPFSAVPTLALVCNVVDPQTGDGYCLDPREIAAKAGNYLCSTGIADAACFAPKAEFFVFESVDFGETAEGGYWDAAPLSDAALDDLASDLLQGLIDCSLDVESLTPAPTGQGRLQIDLRYQPLVKMADQLLTYKHAVRQVARRHGKVATFMPQPLAADRNSGSGGMATHFSLWRNDEPLFAGDRYAGLSDLALYAIGGIVRHAPALCAFTNPTTNSYKRLAGESAPIHLAYSQRNLSLACRIPASSASLRSKRVEYRCPDAASNPYLAFAALLMAAIDGIQLKLHPGQPIDKNLHALDAKELAEIPRTPPTLDDALRALEADCEFLLRDGVFTSEVLETWIDHKRRREIEPLRRRPHPSEFSLYFDE